MATFNATFFPVQNRTPRGSEVPVAAGQGAIGTTALTTSGTAQALQRGGGAWTAPADGFLSCLCDGAVRVAVGETAATGASPVGHYVGAAQVWSMSIAAGQAVSVIDA